MSDFVRKFFHRHHLFAVILLIAVVIRLYWSTAPGHTGDIGIFLRWMRSILEYGFTDSYAHQVDGGSQPNYPPFALLSMGAWAHVLRDVFGLDLTRESIALTVLMKALANVADLGGAIAIYGFVRKHGDRAMATMAGAAYALNPAMMYNSAAWGQIDAIYSVFMALTVIAMAKRSHTAAATSVAMALLSKVQAVVIGPVYAYSFLLSPRKNQAISVAAFATTCLALCIPFSTLESLRAIAWVYTSAVGQQSHLTSYAYNFWWMLFADAGPDLPSTLLVWGNVSARSIGIAIFGVTTIIAIGQLHRRLARSKKTTDAWKSYSLAAATVSWGFFLWNTEVHERFLFPFCAVGVGMLFISRKHAMVYVAVSLLHYFNLTGYVPFSTVDRFLFTTYPTFDVWLSATNVALMIFLLATAITEDILPRGKKLALKTSSTARKTKSRSKNSRK